MSIIYSMIYMQKDVQLPSNNQINKAWKKIKKHTWNFSDNQIKESLEVINKRRAAHSYPINTFQATLRKRLRKLWLKKEDYIIAQRLKRLPSIIWKLQRFDNMALSTMQDVWWLRVVVPSISDVFKIKDLYRNDKRFTHKLIDIKDYLFDPKNDGYRGIHIVYSYSHRDWSEYDGLRIELQIRTRLQHAWATAVETVGTFLWQSLKSNQWEKKRLDYFSLVSAKFANIEWTSLPRQHQWKSNEEIHTQIQDLTHDLQVYDLLKSTQILMDVVDKKLGFYVVISSNLYEREGKMRYFSKKDFDDAQAHYTEEEIRAQQNWNWVVFVSTNDVSNLWKAYPNAFGDTQEFLKYLDVST